MSKIIFVDVDDTLIRSIGNKRIPMPQVVEYVKQSYKNGAILYLWSSGGAVYAEESAKELGIENCFVGFLPKPHIYIDDQSVADWRFCQHILPLSVPPIASSL